MKDQKRCTVYDFNTKGKTQDKIADIYSRLSVGDVLQLGSSSTDLGHSIIITSKTNEPTNPLFALNVYSITYAQNSGDAFGSMSKIVGKSGPRSWKTDYKYSQGFDSFKFIRIIKTSNK